MKKLKFILPVLIIILFEITVGVLLFIEPVAFTSTVIICFGVISVINSIIFLVYFFVTKKRNSSANPLNIFVSVVSFIVGVICIFFTGWVMGIFVVLAMIYGCLLIVSGIYKVFVFFDMRSAGLRASFMMLLAAVASIILGTVVVLHPFSAQTMMWRFTGAALVGEGVFDLFSLILALRSSKEVVAEVQKVIEAKPEDVSEGAEETKE